MEAFGISLRSHGGCQYRRCAPAPLIAVPKLPINPPAAKLVKEFSEVEGFKYLGHGGDVREGPPDAEGPLRRALAKDIGDKTHKEFCCYLAPLAKPDLAAQLPSSLLALLFQQLLLGLQTPGLVAHGKMHDQKIQLESLSKRGRYKAGMWTSVKAHDAIQPEASSE